MTERAPSLLARCRTRRLNRLRARRGEKGAITIEMVLVAPLLIVLPLGLFELGMMLRSDIALANASRTAARVGASAGKSPTADFQLLSSLGAAISNVKGATINYVTVYKVTGSSATPPPNCTSAAALLVHGSIVDSCNTYSAADIAAIVSNPASAQASYGGSCLNPLGKDVKWCPALRNSDPAVGTGPDYLGVAISLTAPTYTKLFGSTKTFTDAFVMRLDPSGVS
jgi:hypothetical protein